MAKSQHNLSRKRQVAAVLASIAGTHRAGTERFLRTSHISGASAGWSHQTHHREPTVWGGTLDGIRGLTACGVMARDPMITSAVEWIVSEQRPDGGWGSREIRFSCAEATAWVLIALRQLGGDVVESDWYKRAEAFLLTCVDSNGVVWTSPEDVGTTAPAIVARTMPGALFLLALSDRPQHSATIDAVRRRLWDCKQASGWGYLVSSGAASNAYSTALVSMALLTVADRNFTRQSIADSAQTWLRNSQQADGGWGITSERWFRSADKATPISCDHDITPWAVQGLLLAGVDATDPCILRAIEHIQGRQNPTDGSWKYKADEDFEHVWCVANNAAALDAHRTALLRSQSILERWIRPSIQARDIGLLILLVVVISWLLQWGLGFLARRFASSLTAHESEIYVNVLSEFIAMGLVAAGAYALATRRRAGGLK